jgi:hypothetical protein
MIRPDGTPCECPECFIASVERAAHAPLVGERTPCEHGRIGGLCPHCLGTNAPVVVAVRNDGEIDWTPMPELAPVASEILDALPRTIAAGRDDGKDSETRPPKPCCWRVEGGWCQLPQGHAGPHGPGFKP